MFFVKEKIMATKSYWKFVTAILLTALIAGVGLVPNVAATTAGSKSIIIDCVLTDWAADEAMGPFAGSGTTNLWITWDVTYLYVAYQGNTGNMTIYVDNGTDGGMETSALLGSFSSNTHQIANSGNGYEVAFSGEGTTPVYEVYNGSTWVSWAPTVESCLNGGGTNSFEWKMRWDEIGVTAGSGHRATVLVTRRNGAGNLLSYFPGQSTPLTQGVIFWDPVGTAVSGVSPNLAPTAIALNNLTARNAMSPPPPPRMRMPANVPPLGATAKL